MLFHSDVFIFVFLPVALFGWLGLERRRQHRMSLMWLLVCSGVFYAWWEPRMLPLLAGSILVNFVIGEWVRKSANPGRRLVLNFGVVLNLAALGYFKYCAFFVETTNVLLGTTLPPVRPELPLAISFFTFQQLAYLVDAYRQRVERNGILDYALFVAFFPQLIAGPIVHHSEFLPQIRQRRRRCVDRDIAIGLTIFIIGLFKKVVLADSIGACVAPVFDAAENSAALRTPEAWIASLSFTLQIYFDFSAYSDMAIGLGRMFGIMLPVNFDSPLKATSISELWRRWHITLARFLRDYLFTPVGGLSRRISRRCCALLITMALCGLWHGAGWTFVVWGVFHGLCLVAEQVWRVRTRRGNSRRRRQTRIETAFKCLCTCLVFSASLVLFRAESLSGAWSMLITLCGRQRELPAESDFVLHAGSVGMTGAVRWFLAGLAVAWFLPNTQQVMGRFQPAIGYTYRARPDAGPARLWSRLQWRPHWSYALTSAVMLVIVLSAMSQVREFIYFRF